MAGIYCASCGTFAKLGIDVEIIETNINYEEYAAADVEVQFNLHCECGEELGEYTDTGTLFSDKLNELIDLDINSEESKLNCEETTGFGKIETRKGKKAYIAACETNLILDGNKYKATGEVVASLSDFELY